MTPQEQLDFDNRRKDLVDYVNWGKTATAKLGQVEARAWGAIEHGELDMKDFIAWKKQYIEDTKKGGLQDIKDPMGDFMNYQVLHPKPPKPPKPEDITKSLEEKNKRLYSTYKYQNQTRPVSPKQATEDIQRMFPEGSAKWEDYRKDYENQNIVDPKDDYETAVAKIAKEEAPNIKYGKEQAPTTVIFNQPTQTPEGEVYKPMPGNEGVKDIWISGQPKPIRAKWGPYNKTTGKIQLIPESRTLKSDKQEEVDSRQRKIDKYNADDKMSDKDKKNNIAKEQAKIDAINKDSRNFVPTTDEGDAVEYNADKVAGWENVYKQSKAKGNQDITPKKETEKKKVAGW